MVHFEVVEVVGEMEERKVRRKKCGGEDGNT
jgi:hypothetical protein